MKDALMRYSVLALAAICVACSPASEAPQTEAPVEAEAPDQTTGAATEEVAAENMPMRFAGSEEEMERLAEVAESSINPLENDLSNLEVAFRYHEAFRIKQDGASFKLELSDLDETLLRSENFILEPTFAVQSALLNNESRPTFNIATYKLTDEDKVRMQQTQAFLNQRKVEAPGESSLSLMGETKACAEPGTTPPEIYSLTMYFRSASDVDFVPLTVEMELDRVEGSPFEAFWEPCA